MAIATLGNITFEVNYTDDQISVFTFDSLKRSNKNRIAKHDVIGAKPLTELVGPDLGEIKFQMILSASLGINPLKAMGKIYTAFNAGTPMIMMIGGSTIGNHQWIISDFEETYSNIDNKGNVWQMNIDISLQEYVASIGDSTSTSTTTTTTVTTTPTAASTAATDSTTDDGGITGDGDGGENPTDMAEVDE